MTPPQPRAIPLRFINRPPTRALARANRAEWSCACATRRKLEGTSGEVAGPRPETVTVCPDCGREFFVIPIDRSYSDAIEVIELARSEARR